MLRKQSVYLRPVDDVMLDDLHAPVRRIVGRDGHLGPSHYLRIGLHFVRAAIRNGREDELRRLSALVRAGEREEG